MRCRDFQVKFTPCVLAAIISVLCVANAKASPVTYTEFATVTGTLAGTSFPANEVITLTATGDTTNVTNNGGGSFLNFNVPASFTLSIPVNGVGSGTFTNAFAVVDEQSIPLPRVDFGDPTVQAQILDTQNTAFASYDLKTSIGPITGSSVGSRGTSFPTSAGGLILTSSGNATFTAVVTPAVPLPSALPLFASALVGLVLLGWRRKRKALH